MTRQDVEAGGFPAAPEVVDTMIFFPAPEGAARYDFVQSALGQNAKGAGHSPVDYLFGASSKLAEGDDPIGQTLALMDGFGIRQALVDLVTDPSGPAAARRHPDRFVPTATIDPNQGMAGLRELERLHTEFKLHGVSFAPSFCAPQVPINDRFAYPFYAKCIELGLPVFITVGVPGPRIPMAAQKVELLDEVCWFFPELTIIMRHGGEPWDELAVKLMRKWPNLYYSTSAFSPKRYPKSIIDFANSHGREKIMFAGYYAAGLSWERVFNELRTLPLRDDVWAPFLAGNARRVLKLA